MKLLLLMFVIIASVGCATTPPERDAFPAVPTMSEAKAREIASEYAKAQGWTIRVAWNEAVYVARKGEWESLFDVVGSGCPYAVYVNDKTGATRAETSGFP
jgi:hypothetical protein